MLVFSPFLAYYVLKKFMADEKAVADVEYDDDGKPIVVAPDKTNEGGEAINTEKEDGKDIDIDKGDFDDTIVPEIPVRKSVAEHIIARKNKQIEKLKSNAAKPSTDPDEDDYVPPADDDDDDSGLSDDARSAVDKVIDKKIAPLLKKVIGDVDENELKDLFSSEPEAKKYEKHIRAYMGHEAYKGVSPSVIFHHLAFSNAQAVGAKRKNAADLEAGQSKGAGRTIKPKGSGASGLPSAEDIDSMSESEFETMQNDVLQGKYLSR
jgi:hypothetical protein